MPIKRYSWHSVQQERRFRQQTGLYKYGRQHGCCRHGKKQMIDDRRQESRQQTYLETIFISSYQCKEIDGKQRRTACWDQMAELRQGDVSCHEQQDE